jgi:hypothetical protein
MIYKPTTLATTLFVGLLAVTEVLAQSSRPTTFTGVVSDSMCGAHHMAKDKTPAECTRICIKQGMKYALVQVTRSIPWKGTNLNSTNLRDKESRSQENSLETHLRSRR